jgi:hypothetical protein
MKISTAILAPATSERTTFLYQLGSPERPGFRTLAQERLLNE